MGRNFWAPYLRKIAPYLFKRAVLRKETYLSREANVTWASVDGKIPATACSRFTRELWCLTNYGALDGRAFFSRVIRLVHNLAFFPHPHPSPSLPYLLGPILLGLSSLDRHFNHSCTCVAKQKRHGRLAFPVKGKGGWRLGETVQEASARDRPEPAV